jgi:hypothetical protein
LIVLVFSLSACGELEAFDLYMRMNAASQNITSIEAKVNANISMEMMGEKVDMRMLMDVKQIIRSETDIEMAMLMTIDMGEEFGGAMEATVFFKDGYLYQEMLGMKMRMPLSIEDLMDMAGIDTGANLLFAKEAIINSSVRDVAGGKELNFSLKGDALADVLDNMVGGMLEGMGLSGMQITFGDVQYSIIVGSDDLPKEERIIFSMEMSFMGETVIAGYDMHFTDISYNSVTSIDFPSDLGDYMDVF